MSTTVLDGSDGPGSLAESSADRQYYPRLQGYIGLATRIGV
jgi:hypothetical protein